MVDLEDLSNKEVGILLMVVSDYRDNIQRLIFYGKDTAVSVEEMNVLLKKLEALQEYIKYGNNSLGR